MNACSQSEISGVKLNSVSEEETTSALAVLETHVLIRRSAIIIGGEKIRVQVDTLSNQKHPVLIPPAKMPTLVKEVKRVRWHNDRDKVKHF